MSKIIKKICTALTFFMLILSVFTLVLIKGIHIDEFDIAGTQVEQLYIKLDKKLIVSVENLALNSQKSAQVSNSTEEFLEISKYLIWLDRIFKEVNIKNIKIDGSDLNSSLIYMDDVFYLNSPYLRINSQVISKENSLLVDINELSLKDYNLTLSGVAKLDLKEQIYDFTGLLHSNEISSKASLRFANNIVDYNLTEANATSIKNFMNEIAPIAELDIEVKNWIYGKVVAQNYSLKTLSGKVDINSGEYFGDQIYASAQASDLNISFSPNLPPAMVKDANVTLKNGNLHFDLNSPRYENKNLDGTSVDVKNIFTKPYVMLNLVTNSLLDDKIHKILHDFGIDIPITQTSGKMSANLNIKIDVESEKVEPNGKFIIDNAGIKIGGANFSSPHAEVFLKNDKIEIKNAKLLMPNLFDVSIKSGILDITKYTGKFDALINKFSLVADKTKILQLNDIKIEPTLNFGGNDVVLNLSKLPVKLTFKPKTNIIEIASFKDFVPFSPIAKELNLLDSHIIIESSDFKNINLSLLESKFSSGFFMDKNGKELLESDLFLRITPSVLNGETKNKKLKFEVDKKGINAHIKDIDVIIKDNNNSDETKVKFDGTNSNIILHDLNKTLNFNSYSGESGGKNLDFSGDMTQGGKIYIKKTASNFSLISDDISSTSVNSLIGSESFEGGKFDINIGGKDTSHFKGRANIQNTHLKDYTFYQQLLTFINSIPSLVSFKTPDFNQKGFTVKNGTIVFAKDGNLIKFDAINLLGSSADIAGKGTIDIKTKEINIDLEIKVLKDAAGIIASVPLINQIILGSDRSISTVIEVRGTLQNPKFDTQIITDVLKTPFNLIKNIIELPVNLFE